METFAEIPSKPATARRLDAATITAAQLFRDRVGAFRPSRLLVFGSRARGEHGCGSDADIAVVLDGNAGDRWAIAGAMARMAFDVLIETGVLIDPLPIWETELREPHLFPNPALVRAIPRDGFPI